MDKCPQCGYTDVSKNKPFVNAMYRYVNSSTGKVDGVYNDDAVEKVVQPKGSNEQVKLIREDKWIEMQKAKAATPAAPATPAPKPATVSLTPKA